ncbi:DUF4874 domain-containing protein [Chitinasiproducens palmae]|uniref:Prepilin-type processing-associated H-X9-DG domain-containing protein n=1 Tax=Chitinasiproducens palmae TaxID=1770053 RepID=A0A1H2PP89_9BURK|nr:DUF4874 domain-containing protein [Chitinasiproducens palmae]SDV48562.1 prepilin-type processing-associated H-X9-DG domain-containing protein [Chitinasiproducens palmae]
MTPFSLKAAAAFVSRLVPVIVLAGVLAACGGGVDSDTHNGSTPVTPPVTPASSTDVSASATFQATADAIANAEGGLWVHVDLVNPDTALYRKLFSGTSNYNLPPIRLVHSYICLSQPGTAYASCPNDVAPTDIPINLSQAFLDQLDAGFDALRKAHLQTIVRFTYNFYNASSAEPGNDAPMETILSHMAQLAPIIKKNRDVIYSMQAGFIGRWGEWHNSTNGNDTVAAHNLFLSTFFPLYSNVVNLEVRYPRNLLDYAAFSGDSTVKAGIHDDAFVDGQSCGSYGDSGSNMLFCDGSTFGRKEGYDPNALLTLVQSASRMFTFSAVAGPPGGSTKPNDKTQSCDSVLPFFSAVETSTINAARNHAPALWTLWSDCENRIFNQVGPHIVLQTIKATLHNTTGPSLDLAFTLQNRGMSHIARSRPGFVVITDSQGVATELPLANVDLSTIAAGASATLATTTQLPTQLAPGEYAIALKFPPAIEPASQDNQLWFPLESTGVFSQDTGLNTVLKIVVPNPG